MNRRHLPHLIAALALAALTACGSGSAEPFGSQLPDGFKPQESTGAATRSATPTQGGSETTRPSGGHSEDLGEPAGDDDHEAKYSAQKPPPAEFRDPDVDGGRTGSGKLSLQVKTDPGCVEQGGVLTVTLKTKPDVQVAFFTQFKEDTGQMKVFEGRSDRFGFYTQTMDVRPEQWPHEYVLHAAAADDRGSDGGHSGQWYHVVAEKGGCTS